MPGRPQKKALKRMVEGPDSAPLRARPGVREDRPSPSGPSPSPPVSLTRSYSHALLADLSEREAADHDLARKALLKAAAKRSGGRVRVGDAVAACLIARTLNLGGRDGVAAARELADRVEGPVVQRTQDLSVRYVVSVTPHGTPAALPGSLSPEAWERAVGASERLDERADQARLEATARIAQGG